MEDRLIEAKKAWHEQKVQHIAIFVRAYISYMIMYWFVFM